MDILNLWNVGLSLSDFSLAAVSESALPYLERIRKDFFYKARYEMLNLEYEKYFNSGVLVMNLDRIRQKHNLPDEVIAFYERYSFWAQCVDQDFLNVVFKDDVFFIDERFNRFFATSPKELSDDIEEAVVHFAGIVKPWIFPENLPKYRFYWETLARSEWNDQLFDTVRELSYDLNRKIHRSVYDCVRHIRNRVLAKLCHPSTEMEYMRRFLKQFNFWRMYLLERYRAVLAELKGR
jgi:lipopolysaccharide biosynthesis glycosyltransferase